MADPVRGDRNNRRMPSQTMPELMAQVDRVERQVALISEHLGMPYDYPGNAETPPEVIELAQRGDQKGRWRSTAS
jgi:hypothetical protein